MLFFAGMVSDPHPLMLIPFALMLASIALMPFLNHHWWERFLPAVASSLAAICAGYYLLILKNGMRMADVAHEYISFIALVGSLYIVAGGIHIRVKGESTPLRNCLFLLVGAVIANIVGTTGASMLMIRPWIRMNRYRVTGFHIVFFIFIVSNIGGCLTPIGDPPLFLGYLKGVPFWWVFQNCWRAWLVGVFALLAIFFILDRRNFLRAPEKVRELETSQEQWRFDGLANIAFILVILGAIFLPPWIRETAMLLAAVGSYFGTSKAIHQSNHFTFEPIKEVAWLFIGIFATMVPALDYLELHAHSLGIQSETQYFWFTGVLSGLLDNAPTYLAFLATAFGMAGLSLDDPGQMDQFLALHDRQLLAISIGAVFFGAFTYIGNGPNFMVKSIAQQSGIKMEGFLGYLAKYSLPILLPLFILVSLLFFSRWP